MESFLTKFLGKSTLDSILGLLLNAEKPPKTLYFHL